MKQETQFSLFPKLTTSKPSGLINLAEVFRLITTDATLKENTEKYRYFMSQGFKKDADQIKRSRCLAFTPAAVFSGNRGKKNTAVPKKMLIKLLIICFSVSYEDIFMRRILNWMYCANFAQTFKMSQYVPNSLRVQSVVTIHR